jgi:hypothetical protein
LGSSQQKARKFSSNQLHFTAAEKQNAMKVLKFYLIFERWSSFETDETLKMKSDESNNNKIL